MSHDDLSLETEHLISLFDASLEFDKSATLKLLREGAAKFKVIEIKKLFQGYRPNNIPEATFIERFRKLVRQHGHYAYRLIESSIFRVFFAPSVSLFESIYESDFASPKELKVKRSLSLVSIQSGWPVEVLQKVLSFELKHRDRFHDLKTHVASSNIDDLRNIQATFLSNLTKDVVAAWRANFSYDLEKLLDQDSYDKKIENALAEKEEVGLADLIISAIGDEARYKKYNLELPINLILLGIDLRSPNYVSEGILGVERVFSKEKSGNVSEIRNLSTLALGYAFIGNYESALKYIQEISQRYTTDPVISGFIASILACSGRLEESAVMFFNSFMHRTSPCTWPLHALSDLGYLSDNLSKLAFPNATTEAKNNADTGRQIVQQLLHEHPSWKSGPKGIYFSKYSQEPEINSQQLNKEKEIEEQVKVDLYEPELAVLVAHHARIITLEANLIEAQHSRNWGMVKDIAMELDGTWEMVTKEVHALTTSHTSITRTIKTESLENERKDPAHLKDNILLLNDLIRNKKNKEIELFESKKQKFITRLKASKLEHYWPPDRLSREEFDNFCETLEPQLLKIETIRDIQSSALSAPDFVSNMELEERQLIVDEFLSRLTIGNIAFTDIIANFIVLYPWDAEYAAKVLDASMSAVKIRCTEDEIVTSLMVEAVIPVILRLSEILGCDALEYLLSDSKLAGSLVAALQDDHELALDVVRKMITDNGLDLIERLRGIADKSNDHQHVSRFLACWLKAEPSIEPNAKVKMLSRWLHTGFTADASSGDLRKNLQMFIQLRDALVEDGRTGEATLLVSTVWRTFSDDQIFEGFERPFYGVLLDLLARGDESRHLAHNILESPDWLIKQEYGVELFLYLCHVGDFPDLVDQIQYHHFSSFDRAKKRCPVLVNEFFLNARFVDSPVIVGANAISNSYVMQALQSIEELEHDLKKVSCYKAWATASDYQTFFNQRIQGLKHRVLYGQHDQNEELDKYLNSIDASEWIKDADNDIHNRARHPASELMEKYIQNQVQRLRFLLALKAKVPDDNLVAYLETRKQPLRERLLEESRRLRNVVPVEVSKIFECIMETVV
jgi:hypothetical protein